MNASGRPSWVRAHARRVMRSASIAAMSVVLAVGLTAQPATAKDPLVVSLDTETWTQDITTELFPSSWAWVAGDSKVHTVWFRNDSGEDATAVAEIDLSGPDATLFDSRLRVDAATWVPGPATASFAVAPGEVVRVDMELSLSATSTNPRRTAVVPVQAIITLTGNGTDSTGSDPDGAASGPTTPGRLATTGAAVLGVAMLASALLAAGWWLLAAARRRANRA